jgi:hypothetical protein
MERTSVAASTDEKEALRIAKVMKQKRMITTRRKNSNSRGTRKGKNELHRNPNKRPRTNLRGAHPEKNNQRSATEKRKNKPKKNERRTSPAQRGKCFRCSDF